MLPQARRRRVLVPGVSPGVADAEIVRASNEFIGAMARGDAATVKSLLQHVVVTPKVRDVLARPGPTPPLHRPVYRTADQVDPP